MLFLITFLIILDLVSALLLSHSACGIIQDFLYIIYNCSIWFMNLWNLYNLEMVRDFESFSSFGGFFYYILIFC